MALAAQPGTGVGVHFRRVPEPKQGKNRAHLDFVVKDADGSRAQVTDLGGQILQRHEEDGWVCGWWPTPRATRPAWSSPPAEGRVSAGGRW